MNLSGYSSNYNLGKRKILFFFWYIISMVFFESAWFHSYALKVTILRLFGSKIGKGVVIKPKVYIKYPWMLEIGDFVWIGEEVRIDNLAKVEIHSNVCISQRAFLLTGNHNYRADGFDLMTGEIILENEVWIGASSIVCPNSTISVGCVVSVASVVSGKTKSYQVYVGNPAVNVKSRYKSI